MVRNRRLNHAYLIPILIFLGLILDGIIMNVFSSQLIDGSYTLVPRLTVVFLIILSIFFHKQPLFQYALLFGVIYDSYYIGIIGIYTVSLASCIYLLKRSYNFLTITPSTVLLIYVLSLSYVEVLSFTIYVILGYVEMPFSMFLVTRLVPTLLLNVFFLGCSYFPLQKLSQWMHH